MKHTYNIGVLDTWSEKSAYIMGAMLSDGNVSIRSSSKLARICSNDLDWLRMLAALLCPTAILAKHSKDSSAYLLLMTSTPLANRFIELGCLPSKSLTLEFPTIPEVCIRHFLRGYFDGDGCLGLYTSKRTKGGKKDVGRITTSATAYICSSSYRFVIKCDEVLRSFGFASTVRKQPNRTSFIGDRKVSNRSDMWRLTFSGSQAYRFVKWLYSDSIELAMPRKYERAMSIIAHYEQKQSQRDSNSYESLERALS